MSIADSTALATWVQALFIAGGTIFAGVQYAAYRKKERLDRTLEVLSRFDMVRHVGMGGFELTAALAVAMVQEAATKLRAFREGYSDFMEGSRATEAAQQYLRQSDAAVVVVNYFTDSARLAEKNLIDLEMFFDARSYLATLGVPAAIALIEAEGRHYNFSALQRFVQEAQDYLGRNPVT